MPQMKRKSGEDQSVIAKRHMVRHDKSTLGKSLYLCALGHGHTAHEVNNRQDDRVEKREADQLHQTPAWPIRIGVGRNRVFIDFSAYNLLHVSDCRCGGEGGFVD